jgi:beta-glucosidase
MDYDIRHGRTYMYFKGAPLYPFGYGLSYTNFKYSNLLVNPVRVTSNGTLRVSVDIQNVGTRDGDEVVQLYVKYPNSAVSRPVRELRAFQRVTIKAGQKQTVHLATPATALAYWNTESHRFEVERTNVTLMVGSSSDDMKLQGSVLVQ